MMRNFPHYFRGSEAAASLEAFVVLDLGPLEVEEHASIGPVDADGGLGVALVGAIAHAQEASQLLRRIEEVEIHALVEVRLPRVFVGVLVLGIESQ